MTDLTQAGTRRIVTFIDDSGRSRIGTEHAAPRVMDLVETPGMRSSILWATDATPTLGGEPVDPAPSLANGLPVPGGSVFMTLTFPPDAIYASPGFDPAKAVAEQLATMPGVVELMEPDAPGFHRTPTLDYVIVLAGEVWLVVDDEEVRLAPGDIVVQIGARHAWQNRSDHPATLAVVLLGATMTAR